MQSVERAISIGVNRASGWVECGERSRRMVGVGFCQVVLFRWLPWCNRTMLARTTNAGARRIAQGGGSGSANTANGEGTDVHEDDARCRQAWPGYLAEAGLLVAGGGRG